jgi:DNA polymerase-3 subunit gamma/tau
MAEQYQVIARKYRPQRFSEVVGQEAVVTTLKNALRFEKIAHAYLFCGSRGVGKTTLARLFAKALNCQQRGTDLEPCNQCPSCSEIASGQSLDVIEIDGASNRGIDDIRQINETVGYAPSHGRYKIYIIDEVHMLTKEAFNALLKTLEEPPERAKFFFATTEAHKVLPTIVSRCQRFDLGRILPSQIIAKLEEIAADLQRSVESEALHHIAAFSDGSLRDAESLFDQILCFVEGNVTADAVRHALGLVSEEHFFSLDAAFSECRAAYAFELAAHLFQAGKDLSHFLEQLIDHYRLLALCKTLGETALPAPLAPRYAQSARLYTQGQALYILEYLLASEPQLAKSASQRVALETILLHVIRSKNRIPVEVLVRRLSEIEESLGGKEIQEPAHPAASPIPRAEPAEPPLPARPAASPIPRAEPAEPPPPSPQAAAPAPPPAPIKVSPPAAQVAPKAEVPQPQPSKSDPSAVSLKPVPFNPYNGPAEAALKHSSHYDTLMRFAAVELEGSVKLN